MEKPPIRDSGGIFEGVHGSFNLGSDRAYFFWINIFPWKMAEEWDCISHVLEIEDREFEEAMRAQVGTFSSHAKNSSRMEFLKIFTGAGIIAQCTARKEAKIDYVSPWVSLISVKTNSSLYSLSTQGLDPSAGMVQATLSVIFCLYTCLY